jgi:rubrerythrin
MAGVRSRAAAIVLQRAGFKDVHSMQGGLRAWEGILAQGFPKPLMSFLAHAQSPEEYAALAWILEDGMKRFYSQMAGTFSASRANAQLFDHLAAAEEHHKSELVSLYASISGKEADSGFPYSLVSESSRDGFLEGGVALEDALGWADGKEVIEVLELCIALETTAYDRYLLMEDQVEDASSKRVFHLLSSEEKRHLRSMTEQFDTMRKDRPAAPE